MQSIKDILPGIFQELQSPKKVKQRILVEQWGAIAGPRVSPHTKPWLGPKGQLVVWVEQSALAFELRQRYQQSLIKRAQAALGEDTVKSVQFYVGQLR